MITAEPRNVWREAVAEAARSFRHGDTIPRAWLETAFGIEVPETATREEFNALNMRFMSMLWLFADELLRVHKMALRNDGRGEWHIVMPDDQATLAMEETAARVARDVRRGLLTIRHTREDLLSAEGAKARNDAAAKLAAFERLAARRLGAPAKAAALDAGEEE